MTYKTVIGLAAGSASDVQCLSVCAELASRFEAEARVVSVAPDPANDVLAYDWFGAGFADPELAIKVRDARVRSANLIKTAMVHAAKSAHLTAGKTGAGGSISLAQPGVTPWDTLQGEATFADLAVISRTEATGFGALTSVFSDVLMDLRLPVLIANERPSVVGGIAVLAWDGGMAAGRAMKAALPLLTLADRVIIAQRHLPSDPLYGEAADVDRCIAYLRRHGLAEVETMAIPADINNDGFVRAIAETGANLLVAGAYGHPRWQEAMFGGVTKSLFKADDAPHVLVSH